MGKVMVTLTATEGPPSLAELQQRYGLGADDIDSQFGVEAGPDPGEYIVLVTPEAAAKLTADPRWNARGPFSNPKIAPFGPPEE